MPVPLICPICHGPLDWGDKTVDCSNRHTFDIAREGYVNLFRTSKRPANQPGDTKEMLGARRAFLNAGWYTPLSDQLNDLVGQYVLVGESVSANTEEIRILDAGCGEGYYLGRLLTHAKHVDGKHRWCGCGVDISKAAIRLAARRYRDIRWCVANAAHHIPCANGVIDIGLCLFAPRFSEIFRRVMASGSVLCVVIPGADHLRELNAAAMTSVRDTGDKESVVVEQFSTHFHLQHRHHLAYRMELDHNALWDLFCMTPIYWRSTITAQERIRGTEALGVTASFVILMFAPK